jgi:drug/metabolite transporter (DMT)-like permease
MLLESVLGPVWVWLGTGERPGSLTIVGGFIVVISLAAYIRLLLKEGES